MGFLDNIDPVFAFLGLSGFLKHVIHVYWRDRIPSSAKLMGTVSALRLFPFKSAFGLEQNEVYCHSSKGPSCGPILDRHWMVVDDKKHLITSRAEPIISTIRTRYDGDILVLTAPGFDETLRLDAAQIEREGKIVNTDVHLVPTDALDCGEDACQWISNVLKRANYRIVYCGSNITTRSIAEGTRDYSNWTRASNRGDTLAFQDTITIHLLSEESVTDLNKRLQNPVNALRFRPNIVVTTGAEPYSEDTWKYVYIGKARLRTLLLIPRCLLTTVDPETGKKDPDSQPYKTLSKYRSVLGSKFGAAFGTGLVVDRPGWIKVGDPIYVIPGDNMTPS